MYISQNTALYRPVMKLFPLQFNTTEEDWGLWVPLSKLNVAF